jgi:hypothetical protein
MQNCKESGHSDPWEGKRKQNMAHANRNSYDLEVDAESYSGMPASIHK